MSLCDCRGRFANGKEMARRRSVSREPQAMLACESLIQSKRVDELISASLSAQDFAKPYAFAIPWTYVPVASKLGLRPQWLVRNASRYARGLRSAAHCK